MSESNAAEAALLRFAPTCSFHERVSVEGGLYRYLERWLSTAPPNMGSVPFLAPPSIGDTVLLWRPEAGSYGIYRIVERDWSYAAHGSAAWPYAERAPLEGPRLTLIVEPSEGPFRDEAPSGEE